MKKTLIIIICTILACPHAFSWGRLGHATIAYIAEQNLSPKAKKAVKEYLHGNTLVSVASLNDYFKSIMTVDMGCDFKDAPRVMALPHTFEVADGTFEVTRVINDDGRYVKNCIHFIDKYAEDLQTGAKNMDDSTRFAEITTIVHLVGDMHCPMHIRYYPVDMTIGNFTVIFHGQPVRYHSVWDDGLIADKRNWSFSDIAYLVDHFDKKQIREWTKGDVWDWARDSATASHHIHAVKEGQKLGKYYALQNQELIEKQLVKAGHRLAAVLNEIFR